MARSVSRSGSGAGGEYYGERLSAQRLRQCYDIAPSRVRQYLDAEIEHVASYLRPGDLVLELGCGYGRVMAPLAHRCGTIVGIDTSPSSLEMATDYLAGVANRRLARMDAAALGFGDRVFDVVLCVQNGISAFHINQVDLIREAVRVTRPGGSVLLSSYSESFWAHRLEWFRLQSDCELIGEIDWERTGDGVILCKDGFEATTVGPDEFRALCASVGVSGRVLEVDQSSVFCGIRV